MVSHKEQYEQYLLEQKSKCALPLSYTSEYRSHYFESSLYKSMQHQIGAAYDEKWLLDLLTHPPFDV